MKKSLLAISLASLLSPVSFSYADDSADETVVVTANRFEQAESSVLASSNIITKEEIAALQVTTALDVLKTLPGVEVNTQGTKANISSLYLRGTSSKHTLVLVDGVKINSATAGGASIGLIPAFAIEQIEVIRGPRATMYGSDAIGGVINIRTIRDAGDSEHQGRIALGDDDQEQVAWRSAGQLSDSTSASLVFSDESSTGYRVNDVADVNDKHGYESQTIFGSLQHQFNDQWSLNVHAYQLDSEAEYGGQFGGPKQESITDFSTVGGSLNFENEVLRSTLQIGRSNSTASDGSASGNTAKTALMSTRHSLSLLNFFDINDNVILGFGLERDKETANRGGSNPTDYEKTKKKNKAQFLTALYSNEKVNLEAGLRNDDDSVFGSHHTWNLAFGAFLNESVQIVASTGTAFKAPTFNDVYWPGAGNPTLKPETSKTNEVGLRGYFGFAQLDIAAYETDIKDMIAWAPTGSNGNWAPSNVNNAEIEGLEIQLTLDSGLVTNTFTADFKDTEDKATGKQLIRRAKHNFSWTGVYTGDAFSLSTVANHVGERLATSGDMMGSYTVVDISAEFYATDSLTVGVRVANLFDTEYETAHASSKKYYLGEDRNWLATISYRF